MSFTYNESVHRYVAESGVLAPGSSYRLVTGNATATETVTFFTEEPDYILGDSEFTPGYYDTDDGVKIYAGYGVTLQENPVNDKQTHFGMYKNIGDGEHSGYVCIAGFGGRT